MKTKCKFRISVLCKLERRNDRIFIYMYTHKETYAYTYERNQVIYFIIGHAYDPYNMLVDENEILKKLASAREKSEADYWDAESNLTGVFCVGYVTENQIVYTTDCAGMQLVYHGLISDKLILLHMQNW